MLELDCIALVVFKIFIHIPMYQPNSGSLHQTNKVHAKPMNFFNSNSDAKDQDAKFESSPIPRIPASMISGYCNQTISIFGRALGVDHDNGKVHIQCPISGETLIVPLDKTNQTNDSAEFSVNNEFILKVGSSPQSLTIVDHASLTDNFDFSSYEFLTNLMLYQCKPLFN